MDAVAGALSGLVLYEFLRLTAPVQLNGTLKCALASFVTGMAAVLLYRMGLGQHPAMMIIGNIMLLIPGIAFTTALRDIITPGETGFCIPPFKQGDYIQALQQLMQDNHLWLQMSRKNVEHAAQFTIGRVVAKWLDLFQSLTSR